MLSNISRPIGLLDLPVELRLKIYDSVIPSEIRLRAFTPPQDSSDKTQPTSTLSFLQDQVLAYWKLANFSSDTLISQRPFPLSILHVNQRLRSEAELLFYRSCQIWIQCDENLFKYLGDAACNLPIDHMEAHPDSENREPDDLAHIRWICQFAKLGLLCKDMQSGLQYTHGNAEALINHVFRYLIKTFSSFRSLPLQVLTLVTCVAPDAIRSSHARQASIIPLPTRLLDNLRFLMSYKQIGSRSQFWDPGWTGLMYHRADWEGQLLIDHKNYVKLYGASIQPVRTITWLYDPNGDMFLYASP